MNRHVLRSMHVVIRGSLGLYTKASAARGGDKIKQKVTNQVQIRPTEAYIPGLFPYLAAEQNVKGAFLCICLTITARLCALSVLFLYL